jgi:dimethylhistidine N-methyltransferase
VRRDAALAAFHDLAPAEESFREAVLGSLTRRHKSIPCRFLYDERGSALFEQICELPEYYLTRAEMSILAERAPEIAQLVGRDAQLIEFGSGSSRKVRLLLDALEHPAAYVAIDISRELLRQSADELAAEFSELAVVAVCADYLQPFRLPAIPRRGEGRRLGFFPGSTIGNFTPEEALDFLVGCRRVLGHGNAMLIGVDLKKDPALLDAAYNDSAGVTAQFILNLLERMNRELDADFDLDRFAYEGFYNAAAGRIEIYIKSLADQIVTVAGRAIRFAAGERIHTEYSCKYSVAEFQHLAARAGFRPLRHWTDRGDLFSVHLLAVD